MDHTASLSSHRESLPVAKIVMITDLLEFVSCYAVVRWTCYTSPTDAEPVARAGARISGDGSWKTRTPK